MQQCAFGCQLGVMVSNCHHHGLDACVREQSHDASCGRWRRLPRIRWDERSKELPWITASRLRAAGSVVTGVFPGQRLRFVCSAVIAPTHTDTGDALRVHGLLRGLAERHDVRFVGTRGAEETPSAIEALAELCRGGLELYPHPRAPSRSLGAKGQRLVRSLAAQTPTRSLGHLVPAVARRLGELSSDCDAVVLLDNAVAVYWHSLARARCRVVDVHQVAGWPLRRGDKPALENPLGRLRREFDAALMRSYEKKSLGSMNGITVTSKEEADRLQRLYGLIATAIVPSGINVPTRILRSAGSGTVGWIGGLEYPPNRNGLIRFVEEAWRPLGEAGYKLLVAGAGVNEDVRALQRHPGVSILGFVRDLPGFLASTDVAVVPVWEGAGVKLKSVTFMGAGIPIVSTTVGLEGTGARDGDHALVRETPVALADGLRVLLEQPDLAHRVGQSGRTLVAERLSWSSMGPLFREAVERVIANT
jgi:glycosyltransferase involved in cell wall biosynthesis